MIRVLRDARPRVGLAVVVALLATGCGAMPQETGEAGIDGLRIPAPSLDPGDFVDGVDNPWLPLTVGSTWRYRTEDGDRMLVEVDDRGPRIAGVEATEVTTVTTSTGRGRERSRRAVAWYAQDRDGNVWLLGRRDPGGASEPATRWRAGIDGARAGLAMAASPRLGDGYRSGLVKGIAEQTVRVLTLDGTAEVPAGDFDGVLVTETRDPLAEPQLSRQFYADGVGLIAVQGGADDYQLVEHDSAPPR